MPVDLSASIYAEYKRARKRAEEAEKRASAPEAAAAYRQAAKLMRQYAQYARDRSVSAQRVERAEALEALAGRIDGGAAAEHPLGKTAAATSTAEAASSGGDDYEAAILELIQRTSVRWDDIGGLEETKATIKSAYALALARKPDHVEIHNWRNLLLYGPPGTGKTILAAATAGSLEATFFNVKVSSLLSKYFGESTRLITALYTVARRLSPSVVFMDEFESLTPPRGSGESGAERRILSTLLVELDGLANKNSDEFVLTIGATNVPWLLDDAILSRFEQHIYVPLPDEPARLAILDIHLARRGHRSLVSMDELALRSAGYSGREIEKVCQFAITRMTRRANPNLLAVVDRGSEALRSYEIRVEPLSAADFDAAFEQVRPVATPEMLRRFDDWAQKAQE